MLFFVRALFMVLEIRTESVTILTHIIILLTLYINLVPRVTLARLYKWMDEKMKFLWPNSLHLNTVHVNDVAKAICKIEI